MIQNAFLNDNNGNIMQAMIFNNGEKISIRMFDDQVQLLGYMNIQIQKNNRLFLSEIYCYDEFRGKGIATKISELADYILRDYQGYIIRGLYKPTQMSYDLNNKYVCKKELEERARNFYYKNGYEILNIYDFKNHKEKYNFLDEKLDFTINGTVKSNIVFKIIKDKDYNYYEDNGLIYYKNNEKKL